MRIICSKRFQTTILIKIMKCESKIKHELNMAVWAEITLRQHHLLALAMLCFN